MPVVRVRPRTREEREAQHLDQLRFGRYAPPKGWSSASHSAPRKPERAVRVIPELRDILAGIRRETSPFTVAPTWAPSPPVSATRVRGAPASPVVETQTEAPFERPAAPWRGSLLLVHE
jgi:hypothetical protein